MANVFETLGLSRTPLILAPLAGITDSPFRRLCYELGADLCYVEMISATALIYNNRRTLDMLSRHRDERILGIQLSGKTAEETAEAVYILNNYSFETVDLNMGCPVQKVCKNGGGSAHLKDPERVYQTVKRARAATRKPLSVKIRLGWDRSSITASEVTDAISSGGADWMTVHGRTRDEGYSIPVDLDTMAEVKARSRIPVIGNGNLFSHLDAEQMGQEANVDGFMIARGSLGNPWIFQAIKKRDYEVSLDEWLAAVHRHLDYQHEEYGDSAHGAVCMRKHMLWYAKGWPQVKSLRNQINVTDSIAGAKKAMEDFVILLKKEGELRRLSVLDQGLSGRFIRSGTRAPDRS